MPFTVGVTGGIGSGKSTAVEQFRELGAGVVDTDEIAHRLTAPSGAALPAIEQAFGPDYLLTAGGLDRARMRELVFADSSAKRRLEAILHPMIRAEADRQVAACAAPYVLLVVPLLVETGSYRGRLDRILVVDCDEATQIARTARRSGLAPDEVRAVMATQADRATRLAAADDIIVNDGDLGHLRRQVEALDRRYRELARRNA